jgi:hypothetical protein
MYILKQLIGNKFKKYLRDIIVKIGLKRPKKKTKEKDKRQKKKTKDKKKMGKNEKNSNKNNKIVNEPFFIEPNDIPRDRKNPTIVAYNDNLYSSLYKDLRFLTPGERIIHYLEKGIYEGRIATYRQLFAKIGPELYYHFDHKQYLKEYEDLQLLFDVKDRYALLLHYVNHGCAEMRKDCRVKQQLVPSINYWDSDDEISDSTEISESNVSNVSNDD